jgi:hypothetical protein
MNAEAETCPRRDVFATNSIDREQQSFWSNDFQMVTHLLPTCVLSITGENSQQVNGTYTERLWEKCHGICLVSTLDTLPSCATARATIHSLFNAEARVQSLCPPYRMYNGQSFTDYVKLSLFLIKHQPTKVYVGGGTVPRIPNLGTRWRWLVCFITWSLQPREKHPRYPLDRFRRLWSQFWLSGIEPQPPLVTSHYGDWATSSFFYDAFGFTLPIPISPTHHNEGLVQSDCLRLQGQRTQSRPTATTRVEPGYNDIGL